MAETWKILLVENDEDDYILTRIRLMEARGAQFTLEWAPTYEQALQIIANEPVDAILIDYDLGLQNGLDLVRQLLAEGFRAPIIMLTGHGSFEMDVEAMKTGVTDYLNKDDLNTRLLERTIRYAIEHKRTEEALRQANEQLASARDELEMRVQERTIELEEANQELIAEIAERRRIEEQLRTYNVQIKFLGELSQILDLAVSDYQLVLDTIARRVAELIGDACVVSLISEDKEWLHTVSIHHNKPERAALFEQALAQAQHPVKTGLRGQVVETGKSILISSLEDEIARSSLPDTLIAIRELGVHSLLIVPMRVRGQVIGTLGISRDRPGNPYTNEEQVFLQELAARAALAITNAEFFRALQAELLERKRVESELAEIQRRMMDSVEAERLQLAQELHDGPMQDLYGLTYQAGALNSEVQGEEATTLVSSLKDKLQQVIQALRVIAGELRPPSLAPFGLEKAIRSHAEQVHNTQPNMQIHLDLTPDGQALPERVRLALFRIYQIALTNVIRHSQASQVAIIFSLDDESTVLEITDNGCGFNVPSRLIELARREHLGLVGAFERAEAIGGKLQVKSKPGQGTTMRVVVPRHPN